jgi:hypothetical protein
VFSHTRHSDLKYWQLTGGGHGIHWPRIDEDISVENVIAGQGSAETARSFQKWKARYLGE